MEAAAAAVLLRLHNRACGAFQAPLMRSWPPPHSWQLGRRHLLSLLLAALPGLLSKHLCQPLKRPSPRPSGIFLPALRPYQRLLQPWRHPSTVSLQPQQVLLLQQQAATGLETLWPASCMMPYAPNRLSKAYQLVLQQQMLHLTGRPMWSLGSAKQCAR